MENNIGFANKKKAMSVYKWTLRKYLPFSIAYWILLFITFPLVEILKMITVQGSEMENIKPMQQYIMDMKDAAIYIPGTFFAAVAIVFTAILSIMAFSYMHNKRAVDFFGSFPVSRRTLFFTRYLAVITAGMIPVVILGGIGAFLTFSDVAMFAVFKTMGFLILAIIGNVSFIAFISLCCGTVADVLICYGIINIIYPIGVVICYSFPQSVIPGLSEGYMPASVFTLFCPAAASFVGTFGNGTTLHVVWWILLSVVLVASCYVLCKKRKAETAQNAFAFTTVEIVIKFVSCFVAGFGCGWVLSYLDYDESIKMQYVWFVVGLVIGIMVANILLHLIFHRGLSKYKKSLFECGTVFASAMVFLVIVTTGAFGYDMRVPGADGVRAVSVKIGEVQTFTIAGEDVLAKYGDDRTIINDAIDVHKQIAALLKESKHKGFYGIHNNTYGVGVRATFYDGFHGRENVRIIYKLSNGRTMERDFRVNTENLKIAKSLNSITIDNQKILEAIPNKYLENIYITKMKKGNEVASKNFWRDEDNWNAEKIEQITNALKKDMQEKGIMENSDDGYEISLGYRNNTTDEWIDCSINVPATYVNTIRTIKEVGYANIGYYALKESDIGIDYNSTKSLKLKEIRTIYFKVPDNWDETAKIQCMPSSMQTEEGLTDTRRMTLIDDEITKCEKVSDTVWKYTLRVPEKEENDYYNSVMFYQIADDETRTTGTVKLSKDEKNNLLNIKDFPNPDDEEFYVEEMESPYEYSWDEYQKK